MEFRKAQFWALLFILYTADITLVAAHHGLQLHQYADDCQVYVSGSVDEVSLLSSSITTVDTARDLVVVLDSHLPMSAHVSSVCRSAYCFLRQLRPVV